jgi:uncharacterized protein (TIRG00374 family)
LTLRTLVPLIIGVAALFALVFAIDLRGFGAAIRGFRLLAIPAVLALSVLYYLLQGVRWHFLLRAVGIREPLSHTVLLNYAGQSTGLLPLGELSRAVLVAESTGAEFGAIVATVTVQELTYTLILIAAAVPGSFAYHGSAGAVIAALLATVLVFVILTVPAVFRAVRAGVVRTPLLRRLISDVDLLQHDTVVLLRRADTYWWSTISALGALVSITLFWLIVDSIAPGVLSWRTAAFIYAVSHVVGAISLIPGGLGAYEASTVGLLVASGADGGIAAAAALLHRCADKGVNTLVGMVAYLVARRRLKLRGLRSVHFSPAHLPAAGEG